MAANDPCPLQTFKLPHEARIQSGREKKKNKKASGSLSSQKSSMPRGSITISSSVSRSEPCLSTRSSRSSLGVKGPDEFIFFDAFVFSGHFFKQRPVRRVRFVAETYLGDRAYIPLLNWLLKRNASFCEKR